MYSKAATLGSGDALLDLVDYCARSLLYLNSWYGMGGWVRCGAAGMVPFLQHFDSEPSLESPPVTRESAFEMLESSAQTVRN